MEVVASVGRALPIYALAPSLALFALVLGVVLSRTPSRAGRFVFFAIWLRIALGALHEISFDPSPAGLSWNALASIGVAVLGAFMVRWRRLSDPALVSFYPVLVVMIGSGVLNGQAAAMTTALTKFAYLIVLILATVDAIEDLGPGRFFDRVLWAFALPVGLQILSVALGAAKPGETNGAASYIGGFYHEGAFSLVLAACALVACFADIRMRSRLLLLLLLVGGILLANYRTAVLAILPLVGMALIIGVPRRFVAGQRGLVAGAIALTAIATLGIGTMAGQERFGDLATASTANNDLIRRPGEFSVEDKRVLSGRPFIWSGYVYAWIDGSEVRKVIGFGPESWVGRFPLYAHNTLVSTLYETGVVGVVVLLFLWGYMLALAVLASGWPRAEMAAAHVSFFIFNMATMPMWLIEGMIFYGLLCGYTVFCFTRRDGTGRASLSSRRFAGARRAAIG